MGRKWGNLAVWVMVVTGFIAVLDACRRTHPGS